MSLPYHNQIVLVTGAAGFIGSHFVLSLLKRYNDLKVISFDKLSYASNLNYLQPVMTHPNHLFIKGDITDAQQIKQLFSNMSIDIIVHFAAESHVDRSITGPEVFVRTNIQGTFTLLEQARQSWLGGASLNRQGCRFHHVSTDEVYGSLGVNEPSFTEKSPYRPNSPYAASKAASDHLVRSYFKTYGLPVTISNCSNNYGSHQHKEKLIPTILNACLHKQEIPIYGTGENRRDWLYVEDHCRAIDLIVQHGKVGESYNIGGGFEVSNLEIVRIICHLFDGFDKQSVPHERLICFVKDRSGHDLRYAINNQKIKDHLAWQPRAFFQEKIREQIRRLKTRSASKCAISCYP